MVSPQFRPIVGGYERAAERLAASLAARGHSVTVIAERRYRAWPRHESFSNIELWRWRCWYRPGVHLVTSVAALLLKITLLGRRFDVWHVHTYGYHAAATILMGRILRRPVVLKLSNSDSGGIVQSLENIRFSCITKFLHRCASGIAAPTRETAREAVDFGIPSHRVHLVRNGIDVQRFAPTPRCERSRRKEALGVPDVPVVISIGRLVHQKRLDMMLQAWALAMTEVCEPWLLVIVGEGERRVALEAQAMQLGIDAAVRFVGHQTNVGDWLSCAEFFLQSSSREGLSNTMLEAMASGLPVVITAVSGAQECVVETGAGVVTPIGDPKELARAIAGLANNSDARDRYGEAARHAVMRAFSIECAAEQCESMYRTLISEVCPRVS